MYVLYEQMPEEEKRQFLQAYIDEVSYGLNLEKVMATMNLFGIYKDVEFEVKQVDKPNKVETIKQKLPIGIISIKAITDVEIGVVIELMYIAPEYRGSFVEVYEYILGRLKEEGYKQIGMLCDRKTSKFLARRAGNKATVFYHQGPTESFELQREEKKEEEKEKIENPEVRIEPTVNDLGNGSYPGDELEAR